MAKMSRQFFLIILCFIAACDIEKEKLPENVELVKTAFVFVEYSIMVNIYQGIDVGYIALEKYDNESQSAEIVELLSYREIPFPSKDSWYTHFMDCQYNSNVNSQGLISEVSTEGSEDPVHPVNAWQVNPSSQTIIEVDIDKVSCDALKL